MAIERRDSSPGYERSGLNELVPRIQASTARKAASIANEQPTTVPAPQKQYFGVLGQRHVICLIGVPNNGKAFVARELGWYLEFFHGAVQLWPEEAEYRANLGWTLFKKNQPDLEGARDHLVAAVELAPEDARCLYRLGLVLREMGDNENAQRALASARRLDPNVKA